MPTRQRPDARMTRVDLLIAAALAVVGVVVAALSIPAGLLEPQPLWLPILATCALAAPVAFRRRWPVAAMLVQNAFYIGGVELGLLELYASQVCLFVGMYAVGAWESNRRLAFGSRLAVVIVMGGWLCYSALQSLDDPEIAMQRSGYLAFIGIQVIVNIAFFGGAWVFGDRAYRSAIERSELDAAQREITAQQQQLAEQAVSLERVRIARELHDVVAHHVSAMGVQAGAARRVLDRDPERAAAALRTVEQSAREAIGELRSMVGALRSDAAAEDGPPPTLDDLPALAESGRGTGQRVTLTPVGEERPLSPAVGLTVYRVVQEALTNARKHAGPAASVDVRLRYTADGIEVEVVDDGPGGGVGALGPAAAGAGLGLVGMRERVTALGGALEAGPRSRGGWLVRAWIPAPTEPVEQPARDEQPAPGRDAEADAAVREDALS